MHPPEPQTKGERTREQVLERAAALFNQLGYRAAPLSAIMEATGLQKGGIYRHFESKEQLNLEAFDFAVARMRDRFKEALADACSAPDRLRAIVRVYSRIPTDPPVPGGCPILNASVEADDAHPELLERAQEVMKGLETALRRILVDGKKSRELRGDVDVEGTIALFIASLEGAVMLSTLHGNDRTMCQVTRHLHKLIDGMALAAPTETVRAPRASKTAPKAARATKPPGRRRPRSR